jgi:uncharacterized protein YkwD
MTVSSNAKATTGKQWTRRRVVAGGLLFSSVATAVSSWLSDGVEAKKNKKRRKSGKGKSSVSGVTLPAHSEVDAEEQAFLVLINTYRAAHGRGALALNSQLSAASAAHSMDMGLHGFFDHINKQRKDPGNRASAAGYRWAVIGENIAAGTVQDTAAEAFAMWKSSNEHNRNMLDPDFKDIGIGREQVSGSRYGWYWTTLFGATA